MGSQNAVFNFYFYREKIAWVLLLLFVIIPFIYINDTPLLLFNIFDKDFIIFFKQVYPQDFYLLAFLMVIFFWLLIVITFRYGKVFCGWVCPQTVFLEFLFKKVDGLIHKLTKDELVYTIANKIVYAVISFLVGIIVLSYIIGYKSVLYHISHVTDIPAKYAIFLSAFSILFFVVFNIIREKSCTLICPYGRVQGIFLNDNTNTIIYDVDRGEPRGKLKKNLVDNNLGDCIDCKLCVKVCPTHIDIRNGNQLECINCYQCVDACDLVMDKIGKPQHLISYNSSNNLKNAVRFNFNTKDFMLLASSLLIIVSFFVFFLTLSPFDIIIKRVPGTTFQVNSDGNLTNLYNVQFMNKSKSDFVIDVQTDLGDAAKVNIVGGNTKILKESKSEMVMFLEIPKGYLKAGKNKVNLSFYKNGVKIKEASTFFISSMN